MMIADQRRPSVQVVNSMETAKFGTTCMPRTSTHCDLCCESTRLPSPGLPSHQSPEEPHATPCVGLTTACSTDTRVGADGLTNSIFTDIVMRYSPEYYFFIANSTNVVFNNIDIAGGSRSANPAKNTDGWDTYRSSDITIMNSNVNNGDDCVSFKPNSTHILVQGLACNGSHGISVGSLGQYVGEFDIVEHVYVADVSMHNASDGARIKVWPNSPSALSGDLQGGGGDGRVNNITYDGMVCTFRDFSSPHPLLGCLWSRGNMSRLLIPVLRLHKDIPCMANANADSSH